MEKKNYSDYASYLVLSDNSSNKLKGTYVHYQSFKLVKGIINNIAYSDKNNYLYDGDIYTRKITTTEAKDILTNISLCKWNDVTKKMLLVASQMRLRI
jgi:hypothetical protein